MTKLDISGYSFGDAECSLAHEYLLPCLDRELRALARPPVKKAFDLGCGNGSVANWLAGKGFTVAGVDPSIEGIRQARAAYPALDLRPGSAYDPLYEVFGTFPLVVSLEVIEHVYSPRKYAACIAHLLDAGGHAIISTPYHGYWKNLALAISGKMDAHFTALWDDGHIKFWSPATIGQLLREAGLDVLRIHRVGRVPCLAKSMVVVARKS